MYKLIGAYFLTDVDQDFGFPAFQTARSNMLFTAILDKELNVLQFLPVIIDKFHLLRSPGNLSSYSLGDNFTHLFFRIDGELVSVDLFDRDAVIGAFKRYEGKPYVILQLARFFAKQDRTRAIQAISDAAKGFELDDESKFSFISSETSLVSFVEGVWEAARPEVSESLSLDDIFKEFESFDKVQATELLRNAAFKSSPYWPYLFIVCESKFGMDEFLYILGREFVRKLAIYERLPSIISAKVLGLVLDTYLEGEYDRELEETVTELMETSVFDVLSTLEPSLFMKAFNATHLSVDNLGVAYGILEILLDKDEAVVAAFRRDLLTRLRQSLNELELDDLRDFALGLLHPDDDKAIDRLRQLENDKRRLLGSIQARLRHLLREAGGIKDTLGELSPDNEIAGSPK